MQRNAFAAGLLACACATASPKPPDVPQSLAVPAGNALRLRALAKGTQNYACQPKPADGTYEWAFKGPKADLYDAAGAQIGSHYGGPTWELSDGSKVIGDVKEKASSPEGSIPWLLLAAKSSAGQGKLTGVTFIQRVDTRGGTPPADLCDASHADQTRAQDYTAIYYFYGPSS
jgi:hypothetical protein